MAKPGSRDARRIAGGARDLSIAAMSDEQARDVQERLEHRLGVRCHGCGRRITFGLRFCSIDPRDEAGQMVVWAACSRDDCDFAERAREGATYMAPIEFAWLDVNGPEAPASGFIVKRNEQMAARLKADPPDAEAPGGV